MFDKPLNQETERKLKLDFEINRLDFFHSTIERERAKERERKRETESL